MTDQKWRSPTGHSIASDVTDKMPPKDAFQRVIDEYNTNDLLAEAVSVIEFYADEEKHADINRITSDGILKFSWINKIDKGQRARDFLAKIER